MSKQSIFDELSKLDAEIYDYQFGLSKELFVLKEAQIGKKARIRPLDLEKYLPVADLKWDNKGRINRQESYYIEVTGSYFPDFLEENQLHFISAGLAEYLTGKIDLETVLFNKVVFYCQADGRIEEYYLLIPEEYDCIREGSVRYDNQAVRYLEIDLLRLGDADIFKIKGFSHLIVSVKLDRFDYSYEYIRLENYFDYEAERDRNYLERVGRRSLEEALRLFDCKADAAGMIDFINAVRSACDLELIRRELQDGLEKIFNSLRVANQQTGRLTDNFFLFGWSERSRMIKLRNDRERFSFGENQFELPSYQKLAEVCAKLPGDLRQSAQAVGWEIVLYCLTLAGLTFERHERVHNNQRFRLYICRDEESVVNPPLFYDFKSQLQLEVETTRDLSGFDLNDKDLREYNFSGQNFSGIKVMGSDFRKAKFYNCILTKAEFWNCNFTGAQFMQCNLEESLFGEDDLGKTRFSAVNFKNALLKENNMFQAAFTGADLSNAKIIQDLSGVYFYQCKLSGAVVQTLNYMYQTVFRLCDLRGSQFSEPSLATAAAASGGFMNPSNKLMELVKCDFSNSDLRDSKFAVDRLIGVQFVKTKLIGVDFSQCNVISASDFQWSSCAGMNLGRLRLDGNNFVGVDLALLKPRQGAVFSNNDFSNANLTGYDFTVGGYFAPNNLHDADMAHCRLDQADLTASNVRRADFQGASLKNACFTKEQLTETELSIKQKNEIQIVCNDAPAEGGNTVEIGVKRTEAGLGG